MRVTAHQLSKAYGYVWALRDVNLELAQGECVALLGPNGAGKSTLLRLLCALIRPTRGDIGIDGISPQEARARASIGLLSPHDHLYEKLTAEENLKLFLSLYRRAADGDRMKTALADVGLGDWAAEYVSSFSSGMRCRLSIAKWLLLEPRLLLVDEPYGVLDGGGVDLLETQLKRVCDRGGCVLMATHHILRATDLCTRAMILRQGRIIFDEPKRSPWESFDQAIGEFLPRGGK